MDNVATKMIFLGYDDKSKAFRCYNPDTKKIVISRDVRFCTSNMNKRKETEMVFQKSKQSQSNETPLIRNENGEGEKDLKDSTDDRKGESIVNENSPIPNKLPVLEEIVKSDVSQPKKIDRQSRRPSNAPKRFGIDDIYVMNEIIEPKTYGEAIEGDEKEHGLTAMLEELESRETNETWELVNLSPGKTAIGGKWIFKTKTGTDGEITRYKARYVAQGFSQKFGEDYDEVFALVVLHTTFRTLSSAAKRKLKVQHLDAETAFPNGKLTETIYHMQFWLSQANHIRHHLS